MAGVVKTFIEETMTECAYARRMVHELSELEPRLEQNRVSVADLYFLSHVSLLVHCALEDYGVHNTELRGKDAGFDAHCVERQLEEKRAQV